MLIRTRVLYILGVLVVAGAVVLQASMSWFMWSFQRINELPGKQRIDLNDGYSAQASFTPNYSSEYNVRFWLNMDMPYDEMDKVRKGQKFHIDYQIMRREEQIGAGVISSHNIAGVGHGGSLCSIEGRNPGIYLKAGSEHTLLTKVRTGSQVLNGFSPTIVVRTCVSLKGNPIPALIRSRTVLWLIAAGLCLLVAAGWQDLSERKEKT